MTISKHCRNAFKNAEFRFVDNEDTQALITSKRKTGCINKDKQSRKTKDSSSSGKAARFRQEGSSNIKYYNCGQIGQTLSQNVQR